MKRIKPPFFEFGAKTYLWGDKLLALAIEADKLSERYGVDIIFTVQFSDIERIRHNTDHIHVFAQHIDAAPVGIGMGNALPEALVDCGASGVMLNHEERPLSLSTLHKTIVRANGLGMNTIVCAGNLEEGMAAACLQPDVVLVECPTLIGGGRRTKDELAQIPHMNLQIKAIAPQVMVMHAAGIRNAKDVFDIIRAGADGTGSTTGIINATNPYTMIEEMVASVKAAWDERNGGQDGIL